MNEQISQAEEDAWEQDPTVLAEIREARAAYEAGDSLTIDEYMARIGKSNGPYRHFPCAGDQELSAAKNLVQRDRLRIY